MNKHSKYWQNFVNVSYIKYKEDIKESERINSESFRTSEHELHFDDNMLQRGSAVYSALIFEHSSNPVDGLNALKAHLTSGQKMPEHLKKWATEALDYTLSSNGLISLDQAFGLVETVGQISAFTEAQKNKIITLTQFIMKALVVDLGFSCSCASRLLHRLMQASNSFSGVVYEPNTLANYHKKKQLTPCWPQLLNKHTHTLRSTFGMENDERWKLATKYDSIIFLAKFDLDEIPPKDKSALWREMDRNNLTAFEWRELTDLTIAHNTHHL